ncbi:Cilia- and flagella-associated protein 52 [Larimichthys crocea]|uniref:Cilia- and flagella-associated protein 52 n=1 Tax=Larimichthys crocea TaxID=215358 RepID=A0A6G0J878_LARCR|nr:Cilia- and flagella-associated protein 52 [Larimichthys crocea]
MEAPSQPQLQLEAVIGFNGHVTSGLRVHPDSEPLVLSSGLQDRPEEIKDGKQEFLCGHTNNVPASRVSKSGAYIASGQVNFMGFQALVIIWDYAQRTIYAQLELQKLSIVVWNIETKQAICGSPASAHSAGHCLTVQYSNKSDNIFVSAGTGTLRVWELDLLNRKIRHTECQTGKLKRVVKCIEISEDDQFIFCGTTSGDIMKINLRTGLLSDCGPAKKKYSLGGAAGKGVTSIAIRGQGQQVFVGTEAAEMYRFSYDDFKPELISTSHSSAVKDVAICSGSSELFATRSEEDIRLWHIDKPKELLRITVPNMTCNSLEVMADGHSIISAWNDGNIRIFAPESGRLMLMIHDAHRMGVTAIAGTRSCKGS